MALNKPQTNVIQLGERTVSLVEAAKLLRSLAQEIAQLRSLLQEIAKEVESRDDLMILTLTKIWDRGYWLYRLTLPRRPGGWPPYYTVEINKERNLIIRFSSDKKPGYKKVARRQGAAQVTIPTRLVKKIYGDLAPGPVLVRVVDDKTLIVYAG